jgi:ribosomal protein L11 methyltransferase
VFFSSAQVRDAAAAELKRRMPDLVVDSVDVADDDWAARSQRLLTAIRAGQFIVAPPWDLPSRVADDVITIVIEPSRGFGTGHHASTRLCLRALSEIDVGGKRVLDLGTGSGVLAMAAACKGAREVLAVDVDPDAIEAARESAAPNPLPPVVDFRVDDFRSQSAGLTSRHYDVVLANLTGGMLMRSASRISELVAPGGVLVMSGFDEHERASVREAFNHLGDGAVYTEEGWIGLVLRS